MESAKATRLILEMRLPPVPIFSADSVLRVAQLKSGQTTEAAYYLVSSPLRDTPPEGSLAALRDRFALGRKSHFFDFVPDRLICPTEAQVTRGLRMICQESPEAAVALLRAFWPDAPPSAPGTELAIYAEHGRIDLAIIGTGIDGRPFGVIVEAKFEHKITLGQLRGYRNYARSTWKLVDPAQRLLLVLAHKQNPAITAALCRNREWGFVAWRDFLVRLQCLLPDGDEDPPLSRFLAGIWERTTKGRWT